MRIWSRIVSEVTDWQKGPYWYSFLSITAMPPMKRAPKMDIPIQAIAPVEQRPIQNAMEKGALDLITSNICNVPIGPHMMPDTEASRLPAFK